MAEPVGSVDLIAAIRQRPRMYIHDNSPANLASGLHWEALYFGATQATVIRRGSDWWIVSADIDWLTADCQNPVPPPDSFWQLVAFPERGGHAVRSAVMATAFARAVVTAVPGETQVVSGGDLVTDDLLNDLLPSGAVRAIAFAWPPDWDALAKRTVKQAGQPDS